MLDKPLKTINLDDLKDLISEQVQEGKSIDYKRDMYLLHNNKNNVRDKQREEFLKDISSFANTIGGHLIIGMDEANGIPKEITGIAIENIENEKNHLHQLADKWIEPRIVFEIEAIPIENDSKKYVLIIRIQQSAISPHRIVYQGKFGPYWARNSAGAYQMDTSELRQAFTLSETIFNRIKLFRKERVEKVTRGESPVTMLADRNLFIHLIPLESFSSYLSFNVRNLKDAVDKIDRSTYGFQNIRFNLDGLLCPVNYDLSIPQGIYIQVFRNGIIEYVDNSITSKYGSPNDELFLNASSIESVVNHNFPNFIRYLTAIGIHPPVWLFVTLTKVKGLEIYRTRYKNPSGDNRPIDRDDLYLPEKRIDDFSLDCNAIFQPLYEMIWNAGGWEAPCVS